MVYEIRFVVCDCKNVRRCRDAVYALRRSVQKYFHSGASSIWLSPPSPLIAVFDKARTSTSIFGHIEFDLTEFLLFLEFVKCPDARMKGSGSHLGTGTRSRTNSCSLNSRVNIVPGV
jgi:hypothetical protein